MFANLNPYPPLAPTERACARSKECAAVFDVNAKQMGELRRKPHAFFVELDQLGAVKLNRAYFVSLEAILGGQQALLYIVELRQNARRTASGWGNDDRILQESQRVRVSVNRSQRGL